MTEITIRFDNPALLERVTKFLSRLKLSYQVHPSMGNFDANKQVVEMKEEAPSSKEVFLQEFREACEWSNAVSKGDIPISETTSIDTLLKELHEIAQTELKQPHGHTTNSSLY